MDCLWTGVYILLPGRGSWNFIFLSLQCVTLKKLIRLRTRLWRRRRCKSDQTTLVFLVQKVTISNITRIFDGETSLAIFRKAATKVKREIPAIQATNEDIEKDPSIVHMEIAWIMKLLTVWVAGDRVLPEKSLKVRGLHVAEIVLMPFQVLIVLCSLHTILRSCSMPMCGICACVGYGWRWWSMQNCYSDWHSLRLRFEFFPISFDE